MNFLKLIKHFTKFELFLWIFSLISILVVSILSKSNFLNILSSLIGVTSLIFIAKGYPFGQFLVCIFAILYGIISLSFSYYGEMITYVFMSLPIAFVTGISWLKHPFKKGESEVKVEKIAFKKFILLFFISLVVTFIFYFILKYFNTPNLIFSTISIFTSFFACMLLLNRSQLFSILYACNDIILIILWSLASRENITYLPTVICFCVFLINDLYGFYNWGKIKRKQNNVKF